MRIASLFNMKSIVAVSIVAVIIFLTFLVNSKRFPVDPVIHIPDIPVVIQALRGRGMQKLDALVFPILNECIQLLGGQVTQVLDNKVKVIDGRVITVSDGDTLTVYTSRAGKQKVRLYGIDCPETGQPGGSEAANFTRTKVLYEKVNLTIIDTDRYGRKVGMLNLEDGTVLNEALLSEGHAWFYEAYCKPPHCNRNRWKNIETKAKKNRAGLWGEKNPEAPWEWRKNNKS
jgi:endonuclease YncB( thermonuclease family)